MTIMTHYEVGMLAMMAGRPLSQYGWMIWAGVGGSARKSLHM